jgi:hypothetical protein
MNTARPFNPRFVFLAIFVFSAFSAVSAARADDWVHWRGPEETGVARGQNLPDKFDLKEEGKNGLVWKKPVGGRSAPLVLKGRVYVLGGYDQKLPTEGERVVCLDEAISYARERHTFGKPLVANQVVRHRLVDMAMRINAVRSTLELLAWRVGQGEKPVAEICMLKNLATSTLEFCANEAMQVFGGAGYLRGAKVERIYRETKVMSIGGGSVEIMKDLAARQMGL